jgi:hypothetical protein
MKGAAKRGCPKTSARTARVTTSLSVLLPFIASLLYVRSYGVDVFYADEWDFVALLREGSRGTLGAADLLTHHNEHVYLFPWGLMLLLGRFTEFNTVPLMYLVAACLLATSLAVFHVYARSVGRSPLASLLFVPAPLLLFSFRQHENMLWGNQVTFAFAQTFSVLALCLLHAAGNGRLGRLAFPSAALCVVIASCSAAPGLLAWPAGLMLLLISPAGGKPAKKLFLGTWVLLGAAVWGLYLAGYSGPGSAPPPSFVLGHPAAGAEYLLTLSGGALFWREGTALAAGLLLVFLATASLALVLMLRKAGENAFWISLGTFSLLSLAFIAAGRSGFGEEVFAQAVLSRYAVFSIPGIVALHGLLANLTLNARSRVAAVLLAVLLVAILAGVVLSYPRGVEAGRETEESRRQAARILVAHETEPLAAFTIFGHDPRRVQRYARFLDKRDYSTFAGPSPAPTAKPRFTHNP